MSDEEQVNEIIRERMEQAWDEGFSAGWSECSNPDPFVNDAWDATTPNPYRKEGA